MVLGFLLLQGTLSAQSTLTFPKIYSVSELKTTGFAVVNPGSAPANIVFTLYKPEPTALQANNNSGEVIDYSTWTIPAKGQFSKLGSELFPNSSAAGWVEMTSTTTGLQGFWLGGDFATFADGATAAATGGDFIFPVVAGQTEINILSQDRQNVVDIRGKTATFRLIGANGSDLATPAGRVIAPRGAFQGQLSDLFPSVDLSQVAYLRVTAGMRVAGTEVVRGLLATAESAVLNGSDVTTAGNTLNFVHALSGSAGAANYTTLLGVINLSSAAQTVTISFHPEPDGSPIVVQRPLPPGGMVRETAQTLFGFPSTLQNGWIQVSGPASITGFVAYADLASGGLAAVPAQAQPQTSMLFDQIAGPPTWYTGISLLNASATDARVEVFALTAGGTLIGGAANEPAAAFTLPAGHKVAKLLTELVPAAATQNNGFLYVRSTNDVPIFGVELFGSDVLPILSNVAASGLTGVAYTPPAPSEPLKVTSTSPVRAPRGTTIILDGNGFGYPANTDTVVFTTLLGPAEVVPATASLTRLKVTVPATAISGPLVVRSGGRESPPIVLEVAAADATMIQNSVLVTGGMPTEGVDIYVPKPSSTLKIRGLGVTDLSATQYFVAPLGVDLPRGQTKMLVVSGLGISLSSTLKVTVSGSGVSVIGVTAAQNGVLVAVKVDSNADIGPRTVFVTDANFDTSAVSGGVYIR